MKNFLKGFLYAFHGIGFALKERNFKVQLFAFAVVVTAGLYYKIDSSEWIAIIGISALVLSLEMINTSIESLCNLYSTEFNQHIKLIKDLAAGAVLLASIFAVIIAMLIFVPKL